jgi:hypothetical protein
LVEDSWSCCGIDHCFVLCLAFVQASDSQFLRNSVTYSLSTGSDEDQRGGAIAFESRAPPRLARHVLTRCVFADNACEPGGRGGAVFVLSSPLDVVGCEFKSNRARFGGGGAGA